MPKPKKLRPAIRVLVGDGGARRIDLAAQRLKRAALKLVTSDRRRAEDDEARWSDDGGSVVSDAEVDRRRRAYREAKRRAAIEASEARAASLGRVENRRTEQVTVESPYGRVTNGFDSVPRIVDTIAQMVAAHQIDAAQEAAARTVQDAWEKAPSSLRCVLSAPEGSGGSAGGGISAGQEWAGGILNDVRKELGQLDGLVIIRICGIGMSVEETARMVFAVPDCAKVSEPKAKHIGMRLRMGLNVLARTWKLQPKRHRVTGLRTANAGQPDGPLHPFVGLSQRERDDLNLRRAKAPAPRKGRRMRGKQRAATKNESATRNGS